MEHILILSLSVLCSNDVAREISMPLENFVYASYLRVSETSVSEQKNISAALQELDDAAVICKGVYL